MKKIASLAMFMIASHFTLLGQNISTTPLAWTVSQMRDLNSNKDQTNYSCTFLTNGTAAIQWVQKNDFTTTLAVSSISGTWTNVQQPGKAVFNITADSETGTITFERTATDTSISLDLSQGTGTRLRLKYIVSQVK